MTSIESSLTNSPGVRSETEGWRSPVLVPMASDGIAPAVSDGPVPDRRPTSVPDRRPTDPYFKGTETDQRPIDPYFKETG